MYSIRHIIQITQYNNIHQQLKCTVAKNNIQYAIFAPYFLFSFSNVSSIVL